MKKEKQKNGFFDRLWKKHKRTYIIILAFAIISFWRGVWVLWDELMLPNNALASGFLSLVVGLVIIGMMGEIKEIV